MAVGLVQVTHECADGMVAVQLAKTADGYVSHLRCEGDRLCGAMAAAGLNGEFLAVSLAGIGLGFLLCIRCAHSANPSISRCIAGETDCGRNSRR